MLTTFKNEIEVLRHNNETLVLADVMGKRTFVAVDASGFLTDYPIFYASTRTTGWDMPERFSAKFKQKVLEHFLTAWRD